MNELKIVCMYYLVMFCDLGVLLIAPYISLHQSARLCRAQNFNQIQVCSDKRALTPVARIDRSVRWDLAAKI